MSRRRLDPARAAGCVIVLGCVILWGVVMVSIALSFMGAGR